MRRAGGGRTSAAIPGTGGRAGALARSWRCAAAALLLAFAALLALPPNAQAQTVETLVSNFGQSIPSGGNNAWRATKFTTGSNDDGDGFTVSEVVMQLSTTSNFNSSRTYVTINNDDSGSIGTLVVNLNTPASAAVGNNTFSAPADTTLAENTSYWLVVNNGLVTNQVLSWRRTQGNGEDTDSATGWSIGNNGLFYNSTSTAWESSSYKLAIDIRGYGNGTSTCDALWCATMTVGAYSGQLGFYEGDFGELTSNEFTYSDETLDETIEVAELYYEPAEDLLTFGYFGNLGGSDYTLQLGGLSFAIAGAGADSLFEISTSDIDWTDDDTVTVKLFEGLRGATLSDDATLSELDFSFFNNNPDDPMDNSDESDIDDFLTPAFDPEITYYTAVIPARFDAFLNELDGAVPTVASATVKLTLNGDVFDLVSNQPEAPLKTGTNYLRFEVTAQDGETTKTYTVKVTRLPGLKASFAVPESHDGSTPFTVTLNFNEDISSALSKVAAAVVVTDGTKGAVTADGSSMRRFLIPVTPDSSDPVRISVRSAEHCTQSHAVCAVSGKLLSTEFSRWVGAKDDARLRALWLTRKNGSWIQRRPVFRPGTTSYSAGVANGVEEITLQAAPYAKGVTVAVSGPAGTFTTTERYDGGATAKLDVPAGSTTWTVTVTSADGNETRSYEMTVTRGGDGSGTADVRLKTLTVTPVDGTGTVLSVLSYSPSFHLDTEAATFRVRVSSDTTAVRVSVEKNSGDPDVRLMRKETLRLDSLDEDPDLAGIQFELTMDRFDLGGTRENRYKSIWVIGPNARVEGHTAFNRRVYQLWITKAAEGVGHATAADPLMAAFENVPLSHDGSSAFTFRMAFSEDVEITPEDMRDHAFVVSGGTVTGAERVDGLKSLWELTLEPTGSGPVSILTPLERACTEAGALCTAAGTMLSTGLGQSIPYAVPVAPQAQVAQAALTASFESVPQAHDGTSAFTVRLAFSEPVRNSYQHLRDQALSVTGGTVKRARRVDGRSDLWELTVEPSGYGAVTVTLPATASCEDTGGVCTADGRALSNAIATTVAGPPPLTAAFVSVPAEHDGSSAFWLELGFDAAVAQGSKRHIRALLGVTGGSVTRLRRKDDRLDRWRVRVEPSSHGAVTVTLSPSPACGETGAVCTPDGRTFTAALATQIQGPPGLAVADAEVQEAANATLAFAVTLSRAPSGTVTVDYATSDGTATAGSDYTATSGTLAFAAGETAKTVSVPVLDDDHDEGSETLTLTLSNPSGAYLADGSATGTITNTDHMPQAWIARFGRTVADQVLNAVEERLRSGGTAGMSVSLGGQTIGSAGLNAKSDEESDAASDGTSASLFGATAADAGETARLKALSDWLSQETGEKDRSKSWSRTLTGRELLMGSSFSLAAQTDGGGFAGLWGRMAQTRFAGREGSLSLDGDVTTGLLGADYASGRWTTGLVVSHSLGEGGYRGATSGEIEATVTALTPWAGYAVTERLSVWGAAGYGAGELKLTAGDDPALKTDLGMMLAAAGGRGRLIGGDGPKLDAVGDARWVRTTTASVSSASSDGGNLASASATVTRLRLGLEGSWPLALGDEVLGKGAKVTPRLAIGLRQDGGDAETGFGADIGGGVTLAAPAHGLTVSLEGRGVLTHEAAGLRDRGIAGSLAWDPPPSNGRGPKLTLRQTIGAGASGGKDALLSRTTLEGLAANDNGDGQRRLEARFGYGFSVLGDRFTMSPEIGLGLSEAGRDYSLGWRLTRTGSGPGSLEFSVEARRRESANEDTPPEHGIGFRLTARF